MPLGRWQLSKPKVSKAHAGKSEVDGTEDNPRPEIRFVRLEDIPIENAFHEKRIFEKGEFERKLNPKYFPCTVIVSDEVSRARITEVFKLCFQEAAPSKRLKVLRDFVAHFPHLVFDADWIKELFRRDSAVSSLSNDDKKEMFRALANGFRSAARGNSREPAVRESYRISGARMVERTIQDQILKWNEALDRPLSTPEEIAVRATEKADEFVKTYPMRLYDKQRLKKFLEKGHCYEAAVLITSKVFGVRERDLESRTD